MSLIIRKDITNVQVAGNLYSNKQQNLSALDRLTVPDALYVAMELKIILGTIQGIACR